MDKSARNEIFDLLDHTFFRGEHPRPMLPRLGKAVRDLMDMNATADEVKYAIKKYRREWPGITLTLESLTKHFYEFRPPKPRAASNNATQPVSDVLNEVQPQSEFERKVDIFKLWREQKGKTA